MKKVIISIAILAVLGGGWIVYNINAAPEEVPQTESAQATPAASASALAQVVLRGSFDEQDKIHVASLKQ